MGSFLQRPTERSVSHEQNPLPVDGGKDRFAEVGIEDEAGKRVWPTVADPCPRSAQRHFDVPEICPRVGNRLFRAGGRPEMSHFGQKQGCRGPELLGNRRNHRPDIRPAKREASRTSRILVRGRRSAKSPESRASTNRQSPKSIESRASMNRQSPKSTESELLRAGLCRHQEGRSRAGRGKDADRRDQYPGSSATQPSLRLTIRLP